MKICKEVSESLVTFAMVGTESEEEYVAVLSTLKHLRKDLTLDSLMSNMLEIELKRLNNIIQEEATEYRWGFLSAVALVGLMKVFEEHEASIKDCIKYLQELLSFEVTFVNDPALTHRYKMVGKSFLSHIREEEDHDR